MTKFKEYLRKNGVMLECDYGTLPHDGIEEIVVIPERAQVSVYHVSAGWCHMVFDRGGNSRMLYKNDELYDAELAVFDRMEMGRLEL